MQIDCETRDERRDPPWLPLAAKPRFQEEIRELTLLFEISQLLDRSLDLKEVIGPVLRLLGEDLAVTRGCLTLLNRETGEISIEAAYGLSDTQQRRGRYRMGEGITGKVVQTGRAIVVPRIADEPRYLDRTGALTESSKTQAGYVCVPIKQGNEVVGTISVERPVGQLKRFHDDARFLSIVASMIAQAVCLRQVVQEDRQRLLEENHRLREDLKDRFRPSNIIGNSKAMHDVYSMIARICSADTTVLIRGESGTGKELVAHAIHYNSCRAAKPFIRVNCAALPESLIESELFGHERGAFTGAVQQRKGRFEAAHGGTLFLDEIGDLSPATQVRLLRILQEKEFERVGGSETLKTDVRVIAATNRCLESLMENGAFRTDLYYRLNVFPIHVPSLHERGEDILLLADHFTGKYSRAHGKAVLRISTPAIDMLMSYHWPGNVRELENCIERAVLLSDDGVIHSYHLPPTLQTAEASGTALAGTLQETLDRVERELLAEALKSSAGNMAGAARRLGITERLIGLRVKKHHVDPGRFRAKRSK